MDRRGVLSHEGMQTGCQRAQCMQYGFFPEEQFRKLLIGERRRTERSKRPFVLVLINIEKMSSQRDDFPHAKVHGIMKTIHGGVRETDVLGWYEHHRVMGVIFTETDMKKSEVFGAKVRELLISCIDQVEFRFFTFPSDKIGEGSGDLLMFYGENSPETKKKMAAAGKRMIDMTVSFAVLLLLLPVFLLIGLLIKISTPGPIFFRQQRVGSGGKVFTFLKFRSMHVNNDDAIHRQYVTRLIKGEVNGSDGVYKITNDPRITPLGRILRKTSLDEFPQLFNVLRGDMSLVGPRPPIPYELAAYELWHFRRFMECKPGITGLWQVEGRSKTTFDGMVRMDIRYSRAQSFFKDLILLFRTPAALLFAKGAY